MRVKQMVYGCKLIWCSFQIAFMNMSHLLLLFLVLYQSEHSVSTIRKKCDRTLCKDEPKAEDCKSGQLRGGGGHGCCFRCASSLNELCGRGQGYCADSLHCLLDKSGVFSVCKPSKMNICYNEPMLYLL